MQQQGPLRVSNDMYDQDPPMVPPKNTPLVEIVGVSPFYVVEDWFGPPLAPVVRVGLVKAGQALV